MWNEKTETGGGEKRENTSGQAMILLGTTEMRHAKGEKKNQEEEEESTVKNFLWKKNNISGERSGRGIC